MVFTGLVLLGVFNGLVFLPVLLLMFGPPADLVPKDGADSIDLPASEAAPASTASASKPRRNTRSNPLAATVQNMETLKVKRPIHHSDASLSTIAEESGSYISSCHFDNALPLTSQSLNANAQASVFVEPEITVETTTHPLVSTMSRTISLVPKVLLL